MRKTRSGRRAGRLFAVLPLAIGLLVSIVPAFAAPARLAADHAWTFDELLSIGLERNLDVRSSRLDVEGLRWDRLAAYGQLLPTVGFSTNLGYSEEHVFSFRAPDGTIVAGPETVTKGSSSRLNLSLEQTLFEGFARTAALRQALLEEKRVVEGDELQQLRFRQQLKTAAHRVQAARAQLDSERALEEEIVEQGRLAQARFEIGAVTELDVLQTEINLGSQRLNVESANLELASAWDALALLVGLEPGEPGELALGLETFEPAWTVEELLEAALESRLDFSQGDRLREQARLDVTRSRATFLPTVTAGLSHGRDAYNEGKDWNLTPKDYGNSAWLRLSLPIFQGFGRVADLKRSQSTLRKRELEQEQLRLQVRADVREALKTLRSSWTQSGLAEQNRTLARRSLDLERERYRLGLGTLLSVQTAEAVWRRAEGDLLRQRLAFHDRLAELELAVGRPLVP